jgi:hypothetical protein
MRLTSWISDILNSLFAPVNIAPSLSNNLFERPFKIHNGRRTYKTVCAPIAAELGRYVGLHTLQTLPNALSRALSHHTFRHCSNNGQKTPSPQPSLRP